jgi:hemolysin III
MQQLKNKYKNLHVEEKANVITHAFGLITCILISPFILATEQSSLQFYGILTFMVGAGFMFLSSTSYHFATDEKQKFTWKIIDHISIFVLIGCSYTAFLLFYFHSSDGLSFLMIHWSIIIGGILFKLIFKDKYEIFSVILYVFLGWMVVIKYNNIITPMHADVKFWLFMGGASYSIGVVFYLIEKLKYNHAIWHIFVLLGFISHCLALAIS